MKFSQRRQPDAIRPAEPTEEQLYPFILEMQENEPVNFAGIPLRLLKKPSKQWQSVLEYEIVTKDMESHQVKILSTRSFYGNEEEAAAINQSLLHDSSVLAFTHTSSYLNTETGETKPSGYTCYPYVRVGDLQWSTVSPTTWVRSNVFSVDRNHI